MMEEAEEKAMDSVASFKSGKLLTITGSQYDVFSQSQMINLLVSSNRYGYIFYATETDGLIIISSKYIDRESRYLSKSSEDDDDDDDDDNDNENSTNGITSIIHRSYIPGQLINKNSSFIPHWIALNADETILAIVLLQLDSHSWIIILYDVVKLIQIDDSPPICSPMRLSNDSLGGTIQNFAWNPVIPNIFAFLDGNGSVSSFEIDQNSKQLKSLGQLPGNEDNSSICWSPKGKQIVVVKFNGALEFYDQNMTIKNKYPSVVLNSSFPPCISVLWLSNHQFLLGFSDDGSDENTNDNVFFQILVTYDKDQPSKAQIYNDLFFDALDASPDINSQYFYVRLSESKIIISGLSKSLKINVLGSNELNQDSLDIWTFADQFRATVKGSTNVSNERPILTGMALGLNSTLSIFEGNEKLSPCPMLLLSNSEGVLQVYYYIHKKLPFTPRTPEVIKPIQVSQPQLQPQPQPQPSLSLTNDTSGTPFLASNTFSSFFPSASSSTLTTTTTANGFSFSMAGTTPTNSIQSKGTNNSTPFIFNQLPPPPQTTNIPSIDQISKAFSTTAFNQSPSQTTNKSSIDEASKPFSTTTFNQPISVQETSTKMNNDLPVSSISNNKEFLQTIEEFQSKLKSVKQPISTSFDSVENLDKSLENLTTRLNNIIISYQKSKKEIKNMISEHIESMTKIENARHQIKSSQKENLHHLLKDRELDPWTQSRLDLIKTKYDEVKFQLNVLLQLTRTTIHDKSASTNGDENEDLIPELEISLNTNETMKQRIRNRILELSRKVTETENDLENICTEFNSKTSLNNSTFTKTTMASDRSFHQSDAQILSYLQANHPKVDQIQVSSDAIINLSSIPEQKKQSTIEVTKSMTPTTITTQPTTPKQTNSPTIESESFKNMLRIVKTSIDLFSGFTSPEQLQELSKTIATSPLSSTQKSNMTSVNKTPTISKATNLTKTSSVPTKPLNTTMNTTNILQTPAKSVTSTPPTISVTPATPATQAMPFDTAIKLQPNKPIVQTATDLSKTQTISTSGDNAIRQLLNNTSSAPITITSIPNQPSIPSTTQSQATVKPPLFATTPNTSAAQVISQPALSTGTTLTTTVTTPIITGQSTTPSPFGAPVSPAATMTTSVQAVSPVTKPIMSTGSPSFGSKPIFGSAGLGLASTTSPVVPFGSVTTTANTGSLFGASTTTTPTASTPASFGSGFGANTTTTTATTSAPSTSPFGSGFGANTTTTATTSTPSTSPFGISTPSVPSPFGSGFTAPASTSVTTSAPTTSIFGGATSPSQFGSGFGSAATTTTSAPSANTFGTGFGSSAGTTTSAPSTGSFGSGFGSNTTATSPFGSFGATTSPSGASSFSGFFNTPSTSTATTFGGFGSAAAPTAPTSTTSSNVFGSSGFNFTSPVPATSTASSTTGGSLFGNASGTSSFGSVFAGFGTQSSTSGQSTGFSFGGFNSQPSDTTTSQSGFGSFGSSSAGTQPASSFGVAGFGGTSGQSPGFGTTSSSFGASSTQSASSPSFTTYRK